MANMLIITGNLVADPEREVSESGTVRCTFRTANNELLRGKDETKLNGFYDCVVWRAQAEHFFASFKKGDRLILTGRLEQQRWQREDGTGASRYVFQVEEAGASVLFAPVGVTHKVRQEEAPAPLPPPPVAPPAPSTS